MAAGLSIPSFEEGTEVESYLERLDCYFAVAGTEEAKKVPVLLMGISATQYQTLKDLVSPAVPKGVGFQQLKDHLTNHYGKPRNQRLERTQFRTLTRQDGEAIADFEVRVRNAARHCNFGATLEDNLVEQFISGVNYPALARKLVESNDVNTLAAAVKVAGTVELLDGEKGLSCKPGTAVGVIARVSQPRSRKHYKSASSSLNNDKNNSKSGRMVCYRCSKPGHKATDESCPAHDKTCRTCQQVGHFAGAHYCRKKKKKPSSKTNAINEEPADADHTNTQDSASAVDDYFGHQFAVSNGLCGTKTPKCNGIIRGKTVSFLIDSGAVDNVVDIRTYHELGNDIQLKPATKRLYAFGQSIPLVLLGQFDALITVGSNKTTATFFVFDGDACNLLSADTASKLHVLNVCHNICSLSKNCNADLETFVKAKYPECFTGIGKLKNVQIKLHIDPKCEPVAQPVRRLPFSYRDKVERALSKLVDEDIIEPVQGIASTWVSPLVVVPKEGDEVRLCVDMRRANTAIVRERYPVPTIQEMLAELNGAQVFSKLDLRQGFFQCELDPDSRDITTFVTHIGLFRMKRLGMGVSAAPEVFQYTIQKILNGLSGVLNMADDIVVFGEDSDQHKERLTKVMTRLSECGLTLNSAKCSFGLSSIKFLGHILSKDGVSPDPAKITSIRAARRPETVSELRGFLGLVQFVGRYVRGLATVSAPLWELTKKSVTFEWSKGHQAAFDKVKELMGNLHTLAYYDKEAPTTVVADASPVGLGCVLYQVQNGMPRVVAYGHRRLSDVESRYSQIEREALGLMWACEHFGMYLLGTKFRLVTDHKPLVSIFGKPTSKPTPRLERWSLRLQAFDFVLEYRPGCSNIADSLSRLSVSKDEVVKPLCDDSYIRSVVESAVPQAMSWSDMQEAAKSCQETQLIHEAIKSGDWQRCSAVVKSLRNELSSCDGVVLRGDRIVVPASLREKVLTLAHEGHQGIVKTKKRLRLKVWWPGIDKEAEVLCRQCLPCQLVNNNDPPTPINPTKLPQGPWRFCSIDLLGPLPDGRSVVVIIDYYSRLFETSFLRSTKTEKVIAFLESIFALYGYPEMLRSDNGPQFVSQEFQSFLAECGTKWISTTPLWPQANGEVERVNRTILKVLRIAKSEGRELESAMSEFSMAYKATPHTATGMTPFSLMFGREMRTKLPMLSSCVKTTAQEASDADVLYKYQMKEYADRNARDSSISPGDTVVVRSENRGKLDTAYSPEPHQVVDVQGSDMVCTSPSGKVLRRHVSVAKKLSLGPERVEESHTDCNTSPSPSPSPRRSSRESKLPTKFKDFVMK